jgi:hypothetical protein
MIPKWNWPDARGWVGIGVFGISVMLLWMMKEDKALREDEFFQTIATVIISNGLMAVVAWAYAATKGGGELADKNAAIVAESATATVAAGVVANDQSGPPKEVVVVNPPDAPVPTTTNGETAPVIEDLPDYAR